MPQHPEKNTPEIPISFRLKKISTLQFAFDETFTPGDSTLKTAVQLSFGAHADHRKIICLFEYKMLHAESTVLKLEVNCEFDIEEKAWSELKTNGTIILPVAFGRHLGVIIIGTTRGILHAKTENTIFASYPMPLLNLFEILREDIKISI